MGKTTYRINEISSPVTEWSNGGSYIPCPSQWASKDSPVKVIVTLPNGEEIRTEVKAVNSGGGYITIGKELVGKRVTVRTSKKLPLP